MSNVLRFKRPKRKLTKEEKQAKGRKRLNKQVLNDMRFNNATS